MKFKQMVVGLLVFSGLVLGLAGRFYAQGGPATIYACVNNSSGELKIVSQGTICNNNWTLKSWNATGPAGPAGPTGPAGPAGIQDPAEPHLVMLRGTIGGGPIPQILQGAGFAVTSPTTVFCGTNPYPTYEVTFAPGTFSTPPSVVVSAHDFVGSPTSSDGNRPVYTVAIDDSTNLGGGPGGITTNGFTARIKTDSFGVTCFGSYNWDFIAVGPH